MRFDSIDELRQKVAGSVCMMNDEGPYYIVDFNSKGVQFIGKTGKEDFYQCNPKTISYRQPILGNIQVNNKCVYVSRVPVRRYKVGLAGENCSPKNLFREVTLAQLCGALEETRLNFYKLQRDYAKCVDSGMHVALSKRYSINKRGVYFRGELIAEYKGKTLWFESPRDMEFHSSNLMSLIQGVDYDVKKKKKELKYDEDDI